MNSWFAKLFRLRENVESIDSHAVSFAEPWARLNVGFVAALAVLAVVLALVFYLRGQTRGSRSGRLLLAFCRGGLLALLIVILGDPVFRVSYTHRPKPLLYVLFDGTDSMGIADRWTDEERRKLDGAAGLLETPNEATPTAASAAPASSRPDPAPRTRLEYVQALVRSSNDPLIAKLEERFRVKCFQFTRRDEVDAIALGGDGESIDRQKLAEALSSEGQVTNLASALAPLAGKHASSRLAGVVIVSDFDQNAGGPAAGGPTMPAERLGVPIYAVGVGPERARDAKADVSFAAVMRQGDKRTITVSIEQQGLENRPATVRVIAKRLGSGDDGQGDSEPIEVGARDVTLNQGGTLVETFDFVPSEPGVYDVTGEIVPLAEETATDNNRATRKLKVLDEYVRLLFVEYEPTWEWRFIKEVFHRDPLVGVKGFRTYLHSAHPNVKQSQELFTSSLTPPTRSEFFKNDVIFLGDIPASVLTKSFCERLEEFVSEFGGGLVVMAGPRFGAGQYGRSTANPDFDEALHKIHAMLPVEIDPNAGIKDADFRIEITPLGRRTEFMRLTGPGGNSTSASAASGGSDGWDLLHDVPWYQPVRAVRGPDVSVLATHPTDVCPEGDKQLQPIIATRKYGSRGGQVVYLGFNEMWRLRKNYGELYYQQFWGQLIHQLGFSHELGGDKRFVVRTDNDQLRYQAGDKVTLSVEAYDEEFKPLDAERVAKLSYRITRPNRAAAEGETTEELSLPLVHAGRYETRFPVFAEGTYRVQVKDPITGQWKPPISLAVSSRSAERRSAVRNVAVQELLATQTRGRSYDLTTVAQLPGDVESLAKPERVVEVHKLWSTWPCFALVVALMLGEWFGRKLVNLP
jgi:hypothetical protein